MEVDVTIEIPKGEKNKYELDHDSGRIKLDRTLLTSTTYPADDGFVDGTLGGRADAEAEIVPSFERAREDQP